MTSDRKNGPAKLVPYLTFPGNADVRGTTMVLSTNERRANLISGTCRNGIAASMPQWTATTTVFITSHKDI